jgi:tetratricopeptide (TPR) repeat protein
MNTERSSLPNGLRPGTDDDSEVVRILDAYLSGIEAGQPADPEKLLADHPALANQLRAYLEMLQLAGRVADNPDARRELAGSSLLTTLNFGSDSPPHVHLLELSDEHEPLVMPRSAEMPHAVGVSLGRYQLQGEIARGGMGAIIRGRDVDLGRELAIKVLLEAHQRDPQVIRRFVEEAQIGGQLQHPGVVPVYELGTFPDRRPYFAMKLVKGRTLAALLSERMKAEGGRMNNPEDGSGSSVIPHPSSFSPDVPRFLGIFEQVCQTIAYAHARGVIHRDLKPSNVMVGSFGEVQVMDWGLAKVLLQGGIADEALAQPNHETVITTIRSGPAGSGSESQAGSVLGTPAYMAPEQARGEVERIDERADVFGLGAILCEILTGRPPYTGSTRGEIRAQAARGDLTDAKARLDASGVDNELVALAKACLAAEAERRPRNAGVVAEHVTSYLAGVQERLRSAELARVEAQARAEEEMKRRALSDELAQEARTRVRIERSRGRLMVVAAASLLVIAGFGGAIWVRIAQGRAARFAIADQAIADASRLHELAMKEPLVEIERLREAIAAAERATAVLVAEGDSTKRRAAQALLTNLDREWHDAERDRAMLAQLAEIRAARCGSSPAERSVSDSDYARAFAAYGVPVDGTPIGESAARIRARPRAVVVELAAALADWASARQGSARSRGEWTRLLEVAGLSDPDDYRGAIRAAFQLPDRQARQASLKRLATDAAKIDALAAPRLGLLGKALVAVGEVELAVSVLQRAHQRFAGDVWINFDLAMALKSLHPPRTDEAIRYFTAAQALRPESAHALGHALQEVLRDDEAITVFRGLCEIRPNVAHHHLCLGIALKQKGASRAANEALDQAIGGFRAILKDYRDDAGTHSALGKAFASKGELDEAIGEYREALRLNPDDAKAHHDFGLALIEQGKLPEALAECREAIRLMPGEALIHNSLGAALCNQGNLGAAIAEFREALRLEPYLLMVRNNLGVALQRLGKFDDAITEYNEVLRLKPGSVLAHNNLGEVLFYQGKLGGAIAEYREALRLQPDCALANSNLAKALQGLGKLDEAAAACRDALRLEPGLAAAHFNLGRILAERGKLDEATAEYREALRLEPGLAEAHEQLGLAVARKGKLDEAIAEFREALRLKPGLAEAHENLGAALAHQGKLDEAITEYREALRLKPGLATAHHNLGIALAGQGKLAEAITEYREALQLNSGLAAAHTSLGTAMALQGKGNEAIAEYREALRLDPDGQLAHYNLGKCLRGGGELSQAISEYREALRIKPEYPDAFCELGLAYVQAGRLADGLAALRRGHELGSKDPNWRNPSAEWVREAERLVELDRKLPAILAGESKPSNNAESLEFAQLSHRKKLYVASARLWSEAFHAQPKVADDMQVQNRYNAACAAALAGCGQGTDDSPLDDTTKARWRKQAIDWLKADLAAWSKILVSGPPAARQAVSQTLLHWKADTDLAGIREPAALAKLSADEQNTCRKLWSQVDALSKKAQGNAPAQ